MLLIGEQGSGEVLLCWMSSLTRRLESLRQSGTATRRENWTAGTHCCRRARNRSEGPWKHEVCLGSLQEKEGMDWLINGSVAPK